MAYRLCRDDDHQAEDSKFTKETCTLVEDGRVVVKDVQVEPEKPAD
jgi:hypothetical protein